MAVGSPYQMPTAAVKPIASVPSPVVNPIVRPAPMAPTPAPVPKPSINVASVGGILPARAPAQGTPPAAAGTHPALGLPSLAAPGQTGVKPLPYGNVSAFGPGGDLRNQQILPGQGADRFKIAQDRYSQFLQDSAPGDFDAIRAVSQRAGATGTLGSGMMARGFADTGRAIEQARGSARNTFLGNALEGTIGDQANQRQEFRTERGYQGDANQRSIDNSRQAQLDSDYLTGTAFDRDYRHTGQVADIGFRSNPADAILGAAGQQQGAANQSGDDLAELLRQYAYGQSTTPPGTAPGTPAGGPSYYGNRPGSYYYGG